MELNIKNNYVLYLGTIKLQVGWSWVRYILVINPVKINCSKVCSLQSLMKIKQEKEQRKMRFNVKSNLNK